MLLHATFVVLLHGSTHQVVKEENPKLSGIRLATTKKIVQPKPECKRQQEGMLYKIRRNNFDVTKLQQYKTHFPIDLNFLSFPHFPSNQSKYKGIYSLKTNLITNIQKQ